MLPKINRLTGKEDFDLVKEKGRKFQERCFGVIACENRKDVSRFGFIISSRISKKATIRNRTRRVLREAVRSFLPNLKPGYDVIFLGRREILDKSYQEVLLQVERIFKECGLMRS